MSTRFFRIRFAGTCFLLCLVLSGCSFQEVSEEPPEVIAPVDLSKFRIETSQAVYEPDGDNLYIEYTLINNTGQTLYISGGHGHLLSRMYKQVGDEWVLAFSPPILSRMAFPLELASGETYTQKMPLILMNGDSSVWELQSDEVDGTFRIQEEIYSNWNPETRTGNLLPEEQLVSNAFEIRR